MNLSSRTPQVPSKTSKPYPTILMIAGKFNYLTQGPIVRLQSAVIMHYTTQGSLTIRPKVPLSNMPLQKVAGVADTVSDPRSHYIHNYIHNYYGCLLRISILIVLFPLQAIDIWFAACFIFVIGALVEYALAHYLSYNKASLRVLCKCGSAEEMNDSKTSKLVSIPMSYFKGVLPD